MSDHEAIQEKYRQIAEKHWPFLKESLELFATDAVGFSLDDVLEFMRWAFVNGFMHGAKHAVVDMEGGTRT